MLDHPLSKAQSAYAIERIFTAQTGYQLLVARHIATGRAALIEALPEELAADPGARQRFALRAEMSLAADPDRVAQRQLFDVGGYLYAMVPVPVGAALSSPGVRLSLREAIDVCIDVALALDSIHRQGFVHGALGRDAVAVAVGGGRASAQLMDVGYGYRLREGFDLRSDVRAFGMLCAATITGAPWSERSRASLPPESPDPLRRLIRRCTALEISERPGSMRVVLEELRAARRELTSPAAAFGEHADWFIDDDALLTEDDLVGLYGYQRAPRPRSAGATFALTLFAFALPTLGVVAAATGVL